ncbi:single-stranded DNA-binding protein [uncultured Amnibacterium sp.]|uniref:single-stranded DNA-binding protein n=1 Tax=uncultured Amnibacterium sp. TaxID=1631851 RepID=UPI0035C975BE
MTDKFTVVGSLGADPERRTTKGGDPFITFSVASNERRQNTEGNWVDIQTSWFDVSAFGALARNAGDALHRGDRVIILGDLTVSQYETSGGGKGRAAKIRATAIGHDLTTGGPRAPRAQQGNEQGQRQEEGQGQGQRGSEPSTAQVDHSSEWAPVAREDAPSLEPAWMSTPF